MSRVWITRAQPGAGATAARVRALGLEPVVEPLLEVHALGGGPPDLTGVGALAFTSANGVRAFAQRSGERALPVLAVGEATAAAAREVGFDRVTSAAGDVEALAWLIAETRGAGGGEILHASAAEPAGDLVGALTAAGVPARRLALYETRARRPDAAAIARLAPCAVVLVHSPRAGRVLAEILREHPRPGMTALCLSPTVAAPLADAPLAAVRAASAPTEDALMALLAQTAPRP